MKILLFIVQLFVMAGLFLSDQCHTNNDASPRQPVPSSEEIFASNQAIDFMEEEKPIIPGVTVRAAPIEQLVQLCVECFGKLCNHH